MRLNGHAGRSNARSKEVQSRNFRLRKMPIPVVVVLSRASPSLHLESCIHETRPMQVMLP